MTDICRVFSNQRKAVHSIYIIHIKRNRRNSSAVRTRLSSQKITLCFLVLLQFFVRNTHGYTCGTQVSNDCAAEYGNAVNNGDLTSFCNRYAIFSHSFRISFCLRFIYILTPKCETLFRSNATDAKRKAGRNL